ncbi:hypothetical protein [Streptomyces endophyticus]|uniref:Lipoprotein n=1 Tax=Streptomyces endophyticus TaxID=714166 RepID=A0ABU6EZP2_9ACTN|nr:hypothetical protein [Streptomyces endophyticus]MEB8336057.1 hypothetical protein [Streptomyces endophyticus]
MRRGRSAGSCLVAMCTALAVAATGCGSSDSHADRPKHTELGGPDRVAELSDAQLAEVSHAQELLTKHCMADRGFRYGVAKQPTADELRTPGYVLDDPRWAREYGYGGQLEREQDRARKADPNVAHYRTLSRDGQLRWSNALFGGPESGTVEARTPGGGTVSMATGGCNAEALRALYGDLRTWFTADKTVSGLGALYEPRIKRNKRFATAVDSWSVCMNRQGHRYADPASLRERVPTLTHGVSHRRAHAVEVRLATAEATCARSSGLGNIARGLERTYRAEYAAGRFREPFETRVRLQHKALAKAERVLADVSG